MKNLTITFTVLLLLTACSDKAKPKPSNNSNENALIIGDPMDCGLDSLTIFPVGCSYHPDIIEAPEEELNSILANQNEESKKSIKFEANTYASRVYDKSATVEYINENQSDFDIRNLLFYNLITGKSYPLVSDSIHILSFAIHKEFKKPLIFFRVVKEDINEDKKYDSYDPVMLYISNLDGSEFKMITPEDEYFIEFTLYEKTNSLLIKTAIDSNNDKKFKKDDETNFRSMKLDQPKFAENIFDKSIKDTLRKYN